MARFLRQVSQRRWYKYPDLDWLPAGELQGDALCDLRTTDNALSVFELKTEADKERVAIALAATRDGLDVFDYAVFDGSGLASLGIIADQTEGETPDIDVNKLHYDLRNLTVTRLASLAQVLSRGEFARIPVKDVKSKLKEALNAGTLDSARFNGKLLPRLS